MLNVHEVIITEILRMESDELKMGVEKIKHKNIHFRVEMTSLSFRASETADSDDHLSATNATTISKMLIMASCLTNFNKKKSAEYSGFSSNL